MVNKETEKYLGIMIESLEKKQYIFNQIVEKTKFQSECISGKEHDDVNWPQFEVLMIEKESAIKKVDELDEGFDKVYLRVKNELDANKDDYKEQIKKMQELITALTDIGVTIAATEERNRQEIERIMTAAKAGIGKARKNLRATSGYITSMYGSNAAMESSQIDSKK